MSLDNDQKMLLFSSSSLSSSSLVFVIISNRQDSITDSQRSFEHWIHLFRARQRDLCALTRWKISRRRREKRKKSLSRHCMRLSFSRIRKRQRKSVSEKHLPNESKRVLRSAFSFLLLLSLSLSRARALFFSLFTFRNNNQSLLLEEEEQQQQRLKKLMFFLRKIFIWCSEKTSCGIVRFMQIIPYIFDIFSRIFGANRVCMIINFQQHWYVINENKSNWIPLFIFCLWREMNPSRIELPIFIVQKEIRTKSFFSPPLPLFLSGMRLPSEMTSAYYQK